MSTTTIHAVGGQLVAADLGSTVRFTTQLHDGDITATLTGILTSIIHEREGTTVTITDHTGTIVAPVGFAIGHDTEIEVVR